MTTMMKERQAAKGLAQNAETATSVEAVARGRECVLEPKLDGWRVLMEVREDGPRLYTRSGTDLTKHLPHVCEELAQLPAGTWLDGEAVSLQVSDDGTLRTWGSVQSVLGGNPKPRRVAEKITVVAFDLISHGGIDARRVPFRVRRELLEEVFARGAFKAVALGAQLEATDENHELLLAAGFEGSMIKDLNATYASGCKRNQWKLKATDTVDVFITGAKPGENGFAGLIGSLEFAQHDADGNAVSRGRCSGSMSLEQRRWFTENLDELVAAKAVIEITHLGVFPPSEENPQGAFRSPQYKRLRPDKGAEEVTLHDS
jgi:ATP-dependent DNA ligase